MEINNSVPVSYSFSQVELEELSKTLQTPLMQAYLGSLQASAAQSEFSMDYGSSESIDADLATRALMNNSFVRGQLAMILQIRNLSVQSTKGDK